MTHSGPPRRNGGSVGGWVSDPGVGRRSGFGFQCCTIDDQYGSSVGFYVITRFLLPFWVPGVSQPNRQRRSRQGRESLIEANWYPLCARKCSLAGLLFESQEARKPGTSHVKACSRAILYEAANQPTTAESDPTPLIAWLTSSLADAVSSPGSASTSTDLDPLLSRTTPGIPRSIHNRCTIGSNSSILPRPVIGE